MAAGGTEGEFQLCDFARCTSVKEPQAYKQRKEDGKGEDGKVGTLRKRGYRADARARCGIKPDFIANTLGGEGSERLGRMTRAGRDQEEGGKGRGMGRDGLCEKGGNGVRGDAGG